MRTKKPGKARSFPQTFSFDSWEHIVASLEEGILVIDQDGRIVFVNPAAEHLTGLSQTHAGHIAYPEALAANPWIIEIVQRAQVSKYSRTAGEGELRSRSHRTTLVRLTCSPMVNTRGKQLGLILGLHDLSYQKELAEEMQREDRLAHLGVVAAGLAHEIKNPLAGIRGAAQLLQARLRQDPAAAEYTTIMIREIDRLGGLLEQMLQLSSPPRFDPQPINVHKVLTDVLLLERPTVPKSVEIRTLFDPSLPDVVGDAAQLAQVFRNLIQNGIQALADRLGGKLQIATRMATDFHLLRPDTGEPESDQRGQLTSTRLPHPGPGPGSHPEKEPPKDRRPLLDKKRRGRLLSIDFIDNGPGIAPSQLSQLFTPFFTTKSHGTGLGLPVSQQIIAQHGGTIRIESTPGQGTLVHVYLPITPSEDR